ncbi:hypothetical protein T01_9426 [Trichinella spiralis]|uniref:Uncharacterized protein n=1 Tax=Trichinella spiralis TaxID=6334 RepID=A0A0V1BQP4_TRISP|nr:hypothetical protein T01_9426 [Trichinella spiralis]
MGLNLTDGNGHIRALNGMALLRCEFTLSQHCNTSRRESWTGVESGKVKESTLLRTANERTILLRHTASRNSAFEAALRSFHSRAKVAVFLVLKRTFCNQLLDESFKRSKSFEGPQ